MEQTRMKLAIDGGSPVRAQSFPSWPEFGEAEEIALIRSLRQGQWWRATGRENVEFEKEFCAHHGCDHGVTMANGTLALEIALLAAGIRPGDEVIVPAFTFISTSMACQRVGALPVPVDVLASSYCIDPAAVRAGITAKTRAIIPVHMCGHFCDMEALSQIAAEHNLILIQDAAHACGARGQNRRRIGEWNTLACFSFQNFKLMTAGEGGFVACPNERIRERVFLYSNCGRPASDRSYQHSVVGTNGRMSEFSAAVLRVQLTRLDRQTETRERNAAVLSGALRNDIRIAVQGHTEVATVHPHYMYMFTLQPGASGRHPDRDHVVECLIAEGIPAFRAYQAIYRTRSFWPESAPQGFMETLSEACPVTENIARNGIWIHHRALLGTSQDTLDIAKAIDKVLSLERAT